MDEVFELAAPLPVSRALNIGTQLLGAFLPAGLKRLLFQQCLGWTIGKGTRIGLSLFLCDHVTIGANCHIGHFNMFRHLKDLRIGDGSLIHNFNDIMAGKEDGWPRSFWVGAKAQITSHHFFDCAGGIQIGDYSLIGGRGSQCWTHFYDCSLHVRALSIGDRCYICSRVTLVYCQIPNDSVVGAGAVVTGDFSKERSILLAGNPAEIKKHYG